MAGAISRFVTAWQLVVKQGLAHWRLLSTVVLGVLLASAIMSGTVIYYDALRELALLNTLAKHTTNEKNILVQAQRGPTTRDEYRKVSRLTNQAVDVLVDWVLRYRVRGGKSFTFFLTEPGQEALAGDDNARAYFSFLPDLPDKITLLPGGRLPSPKQLSTPDETLVLEAMIPIEAAELFEVGVGDRFSAVPPWDDIMPHVSVVISGVFQRNDPEEEYWHLEKGVLMAVTGPNFRTAPFYISEEAFMTELGGSLRDMDSTYAWLLAIDEEKINARNSAITLADVEGLARHLGSALPGYRQTTVLDSALRESERRLFFSKLPMFVVLILIAVVILYYVVTLSSLVVEERRSQVALLRSRGATSAQILAVFVLEGASIAVLSMLAGPLLALGAIALMGFTPAFSDLTGGSVLPASLSAGAFQMGALGGLLGFAALIIPAVQASRIGVTRHRQESARPARMPAFQRYYVDVLLLLLALWLFRQLTEQGSVVATRLFGELAVSQLLLVLPGLMLVASAMVLLRVFPVVMNLGSKLMSSWLPAGLVLGVWQMARNPTHYARLALLLILTAGLGIFASSFGGTLERSFTDRVMYSTGSDVRVEGVRPLTRRVSRFRTIWDPDSPDMVETYEDVPGVTRASPVLRGSGRDLTKLFGEHFTMLAVDGDSLIDVAEFRQDFASKPLNELLTSLKQATSPQGIQIPEGSRNIRVRLRADRPQPSVRVTARFRNAQGRHFSRTLGNLTSGDWTVLTSELDGGPLTLVSLRVDESGFNRSTPPVRTSQGPSIAPGAQRERRTSQSVDLSRVLHPGSLMLDYIRVTTGDGQSATLEEFDDPSQWSVLKVTAESISDSLRLASMDGEPGVVQFSWTEGRAQSSRGIFPGSERQPLPILASKGFLRATGHSNGDEFDASVSGYRVPVRLEGSVDMFPTMVRPGQKFVIVDLDSLVRYANLGATNRELMANEVWVSSEEPSGLDRDAMLENLDHLESYSSVTIHDRAAQMADTKVDPLVAAGWRALLFIAFSAVLVLSCLGFLVHAYVSFKSRQLQFALLRTVGFSTRQLVSMVWLEQALVIAVGLALGTWMGGRLGATIMPFLGHDDWGGQVIPPFILEVNWTALLTTYAAMTLVFAAITLGLIWFIHRISLQRILRLGEM